MLNKFDDQSSIRNFRKVHDGLLRGGQPSPIQLCELSRLGVSTVVSLRTSCKAADKERAAAEMLGMKFIHIPMYYYSPPTASEMSAFLAVVEDIRNQPVFVHCFHGVDRTGFLVAVYRIANMGWDFDRAYEEMKRCGFHAVRLPHFKWLLLEYARGLGAAPTGGNFRIMFSVKRT